MNIRFAAQVRRDRKGADITINQRGYRMANYSKKYSDKSFWGKVGKVAGDAGKKVIRTAFLLYFCMIDPKTPAWAKAAIAAALGYFIFPIDLIPDFTPPPPVGYSDDLVVMSQAIVALGTNIKKLHKQKADKQISELFE